MTFLLKSNQDLNKELENFSSHSKINKRAINNVRM